MAGGCEQICNDLSHNESRMCDVVLWRGEKRRGEERGAGLVRGPVAFGTDGGAGLVSMDTIKGISIIIVISFRTEEDSVRKLDRLLLSHITTRSKPSPSH